LIRKLLIFELFLPNDVNEGAANPGDDTDDGVIKLA